MQHYIIRKSKSFVLHGTRKDFKLLLPIRTRKLPKLVAYRAKQASKRLTMSPSPVSHPEEQPDPAIPPVQEKVKRRWVSYLWDTFDKSPEERRLLFKLDSAILTFASLGESCVTFASLARIRS